MDSMTKRKQNSLFITLDDLVSEDHPYRKLDALLSFDELANPFLDIYSAKGRKEKGVSFGLRTLVLQFIEDISDREMERFLRENNSAKWFCELGLTEKTPDHSYFGDFRKRLGTKNIMAVFQRVRESLKAMGLIREVFTFVDASHLISKLTTWDDRDRSIKAGLEKFNNDTAEKIAVDMQSGLINKIAATSAEVTDASGLTHVCPNGGAVFGDKGYCVNPAKSTLKRNGCHDATIKKANMKGKDTEKDRWISKMRSPYERVFAHRNRRVRYRGLEKVQFQVGIRALTFNLKRMITLGFNNIDLVPA